MEVGLGGAGGSEHVKETERGEGKGGALEARERERESGCMCVSGSCYREVLSTLT